MAKLNVVGLDMYLNNLRNMNQELRNINKGALGEGAKVAAEEMRNALLELPIRPDKYTGRQHSERLYGVTENEFYQILDNFGIARHKETGKGWNTSIGFHGMVDTPSAMFNDSVPTGMLVQAVEYGTEFRKPVHILSKAAKACEGEVREAMEKYIDDKINKIMK